MFQHYRVQLACGPLDIASNRLYFRYARRAPAPTARSTSTSVAMRRSSR